MNTTAIFTATSARIADFYQTNQSAINRNLISIGTGNRVNSPEDDPVDYCRIQRMNTTLSGVTRMQQDITSGSSLLSVAEQAGTAVYNNLADMQNLLNEYYDPQSTDDQKSVDAIQFNALAAQTSSIIDSTYYNGKQLIADSSTNPLLKVMVSPDDPTQTFQISYGSQDIVDVSGLTLGQTGQAGENAALQTQFGRAESYLANTKASSEAMTSFYSLANSQQVTLQQTVANEQNCDTGAVMAQLTKQEVCQQGSLAMLAQANLAQQNMISLLLKF